MRRPFRTSLIALGIAAAAGAAWLYMRSAAQEPGPAACAERAPQPRIVAFGDSLVTGFGADTEGGFVTLAARELGVPIENLGRNGETTAGGRDRVQVVLARDPDLVLVLLGGNDALRRTSAADVEANLRAIVSAFTTDGARVVLLGVPGGLPFSDPYPALFERLAELPGVTYVPNVLSGILGNRELMSDQIHPNEAGHRRIAERVVPALRTACASLSPAE